MKISRMLLGGLILTLGCIGTAFAHGYPRGQVGVYFGPVWGPTFYPAPIYYPPPQVIVVPPPPPQPQVYIEQQVAPAAPIEQSYWYYCASSKAYYPYVKMCKTEWQKVLPQPEH